MTKIFKKLGLCMSLLVIAGGLLVPATASAQLFDDAKKDACEALNVTSGASGANSCSPNSGNRVNNIITTVINILSMVIGVVAVIVIIISGLKYITSQGDSASVTSAKNTMLYAIIGLVVVALAQGIVQFVLKRTI